MKGIFVQVEYTHHLISFSEKGHEDLAAQVNGWTPRAREEFIEDLVHHATRSEYPTIAAYHFFDSFAPMETLIPTYEKRDREIRGAEQARHDALVEEARRTGRAVVIHKWMEPDEEDGFYYHEKVMTPEGKIEIRTTRGY